MITTATFKQLRYFVTVAHELHFGKSAKILNISQAPLSATIMQLERNVGVKLFERSSRTVSLTQAGQAFADRARRLLADLEEGASLARAIAGSPGGIVRIGFVPAMIFRHLPEIIHKFNNIYKSYAIELREMSSSEQVDALARRQIDLGLMHNFRGLPGLASMVVSTESIVCCMSAEHILSRSATISLSQIASDQIIVYSRDKGSMHVDQVVEDFRKHGLEPKVVHEVANGLTILLLVSKGIGLGLVPESLAGMCLEGVVFSKIAEPSPKCVTNLVWCPEDVRVARDAFISLFDIK